MSSLPANRISESYQDERPANQNSSQPLDAVPEANYQINPLTEQPENISNSSVTITNPENSGSSDRSPNDNSDFNWQANKATVIDRLSFMFVNEKLSDVHFIVGRDESRQTIPAHKFVLAIGSAVFDAMFNGTLASNAEEIEIPDVEPSAFLALLRFLYTDNVKIGPETVMTTLYTAKKYAVPALEAICVDFLKSNLGPDNAFMLLTQARLFDEHQLASLCLETIDKNTAEALAADGFTDIDLETLRAVLKRDTLRISETKLYLAVIRWCEAECGRQGLPVTGDNLRSILGPSLFLIRFPLMSVEEFACGPAQSSILNDREIVSLFLYFTLNPKPSIIFKDTPRCSVTGKEHVVNRFQSFENRWGYSGTSDRIKFVVDKRIFIVGFGLYGSFLGPADYDVHMEVDLSASDVLCGYNHTRFSSDGSNNTYRVMFKDPIQIKPNTSYIASVTLKGPDSYYGTKGMRRVAVQCPDGKVTFQFYYSPGTNNGTSVEDGQIPEILFYT